MNDPLNFCRAEDFFNELPKWGGPTSVTDISDDYPADIKEKDHWHGVTLTFNDNTRCVVQFVRPTMWRVRYDPAVTGEMKYSDVNSRTIVMDHMSELTGALDGYIGLKWTTTLTPSDTYWTFESKVTGSTPPPGRPNYYKEGEGMKLILYKEPFRIQALRILTPYDDLYPMPNQYLAAATMPKEKIVWQTSPKTFRHHIHEKHTMLKDVVLDIVKAGHGEFVGFGEQGGTSFMKKACFMNYFNCDNMQYQQVYNKGPLDAREPLYHSDPFYLDVNSNPEHANVTATFLDNYSQISVDFGRTNAGYIKLGTRFGAMDCYLISANTVPEIVRLYTSLMGRPRLKPRYILGNHQACYGYEDDDAIATVYKKYRANKFPLDGLHIDVDFQCGFRTFTIDPGFFGKTKPKVWPGPKEMFTELRENGIKCSTNITPVISIHDIQHEPVYPEGYTTLNTGLKENRFITDERYLDSPTDKAEDVRYIGYGGGVKYEINPNSHISRPDYGDPYVLSDHWNKGDKGALYHGAVSYGYFNGTAGYYTDLNKKENRIWWGKQYKYLFRQGLEFVWQDMTTPAIGEAYGDMKGPPSRLLVSSDHNGLSVGPEQKKLAIEIWALYSYNLHKATANGLDHLGYDPDPKENEGLEHRRGKRNFILGRGSYAGMYRYAGLWTGDNASTWNFWRITVSQVLSVGLNGVSIAGADTGGFEPGKDKNGAEEKWCSPELIIRWYAGSFLLPWLRNHYVKKKGRYDDEGTRRKYFQEPYAYPEHAYGPYSNVPESDRWIYDAVLKISKYYVELRYCLMQLLYDAMFENIIDGLPIARSMLLTDTQDTSFFNESQPFLDNQYLVRRDILVAPVMQSREEIREENKSWDIETNRDVYLPISYLWYPFNLRPWNEESTEEDDKAGYVRLSDPAEGGSVINYISPINGNHGDYHRVTPVYIREGGIIPQLKVTQYVGDLTKGPNHIRFHIYPGKDRVGENSYITYLDDGVSRESAPDELVYNQQTSGREKSEVSITEQQAMNKYLDPLAKGKYRAVSISQETSADLTRTIKIERIDRGSEKDYSPEKELGNSYTIILWYPPQTLGKDTIIDSYEVAVNGEKDKTAVRDSYSRMIKVEINEVIGTSLSVEIKVTPRQYYFVCGKPPPI